jgi:prepilin-type N-terminal cleavage/methylation domain-containing protein
VKRSSQWRRTQAFSLIEVVIAIGIFALVALPTFALLSVALNIDRDSQSESAAVNAMTALINDRLATPLASNSIVYNLTALTSKMGVVTNSLNLDQTDSQTTQPGTALYKVQVVFTPPPASSVSSSLDPFLMYCLISWPANASTPDGKVETVISIPQSTP